MKIRAGILHYRFWPGVCSTIDALLAQTRPPDEIVQQIDVVRGFVVQSWAHAVSIFFQIGLPPPGSP